nr:hypothetical protein [Tanacetum cinerariifolium]
MSQFGQITHTHQYVVPFHTKKIFTTLRVNSPSFSGRIVPFFDTMLIHQGEGSGTPTEPHHTPSPEADTSHPTTSSFPLPSIPTAPIPPVTQTVTTPIRQYSRRARIAQSSALPTVADEHASPVRDVSKGEACPTESGVIADQDRATIANLQRQHSELLAKFQAQEVEILRLKERVQVLEDREGVATKHSGDDAPIKGRSINEGEAAVKRISNDSEDIRMNEQIARDAEVEDFIPMGSKEEAERLKRKGLNLEQEHVKKQKSSEQAPEMEKSTEEIIEEKMKEMMQVEIIRSKWSASCDCQRQRDLHASRKRLSSQKRFSTYDDQLQASDNHFILESLNAEGASSLGEDCWDKIHKAFPLP